MDMDTAWNAWKIMNKYHHRNTRQIKQTISLKLLIISCLFFTPLSTLLADEWIYTTRPGDTIWDISKKHLKSVHYWSRVQQHNDVDIARQLSPGTRLRIPVEWLKTPVATANVVSVTGNVEHITADESTTSPLAARDTLAIGDRIRTATNSSALIQFADGSTLLIQQNSEVEFNSLSAYGETGMVDTRLRLQQGRVETSVKKLRQNGSRYEITTPAAVAAVRGTQFRVAYENDQSTMGSEVVEGKINVAAAGADQGINEGFGTITEKGQPPLPPVKLLPAPTLANIADRIRYLPYPLQWTALQGAQQYRIQLSPESAPETLAYESLGERNTHELGQVDDGAYILKIRGIDKLGLEGFSAEKTITIDTQFPTVSGLQPEHEASISAAPYHFSWDKLDGVVEYRIQLASDSAFTHLIIDETVDFTNFIHNSNLQQGDYFWRVAAYDKDGNQGRFTDAHTLTVSDSNRHYYWLLLIPLLFL